MFAEKYGPWAVIAGASEGIGAGFARQGVNVVLLARKPQPLEEVAQEIRGTTKAQVRAQSVDLSAADLKEQIQKLTGDIEVGMVVYNAGAESKMVPFLDRPMDELMRQRRRGGTIVVGSMAGFAGGSRMRFTPEAKPMSRC